MARKVAKLEDLFGGPLGWISEGLALPKAFTAESEGGDGPGFRIAIDVELIDKRLVAKRVCVETDSERGVTAANLRDVPIRRIVSATAVTKVLRVELSDPQNVKYSPTNPDDGDVVAAVEAATKYVAVKA